MTRRERLRRCYFHEEMDRPAVYSRTGYPADDPSYDPLRAYLAEHSELKRGWWSGRVQGRPPVETRREPHSDDWEREVSVLHAPAGDLEASRLVSLRGQPGLDRTHFINSAADAETYLSLPMPEVGGEVSSFFEADREVGEAGIAEVSLGHNPGGIVAELCGSENFAIMSVTDRDVIHALLARERDVILTRLKYLLQRGLGPYFSLAGQEFIAPPLHGPRDFDEFNIRYDRPIIDRVHEAGGRVHVHCHGAMKKVIGSFVEAGVDVLHPFEAPPLGDITPAEAKQAARGPTCLEGNIQINEMYESTPERIREQVRALIEAVFDDRRGLIVSPTASPYIRGAGGRCLPQYEAMVEAVLDWAG